MPLYTPKCYTLQLSQAGDAPLDAETQFFGGLFSIDASPTADIYRVYIPRAGIIKRVDWFNLVVGTLGSGESTSAYIRVNNTTDTLITSSMLHNALKLYYSNAALAIVVNAGDYIEAKMVHPTWVTNPTSIFSQVIVYIETP